MINCNLAILFGCDNRVSIVSDTLRVCRESFGKMLVINTGPSDFSIPLGGLATDIINIPYFYGDLEPARRAMLQNMPANEWFLFLDSDETPSQMLLSNLQSSLEELEATGKNCARFPWYEHSLNIDGKMYLSNNGNPVFPKTWDDAILVGGFYGKRLTKNDGKWDVITNYGMHEEFRHLSEAEGYCPYPIVHKKSYRQFRQSNILSSYSMPSVHMRPDDQHAFLNSENYNRLTEFKKKTRVFTSNDLVLKIRSGDVEFRELFKQFADSLVVDGSLASADKFPFFSFKNFASIEFDLSTPASHCGKECCRYGDIQL